MSHPHPTLGSVQRTALPAALLACLGALFAPPAARAEGTEASPPAASAGASASAEEEAPQRGKTLQERIRAVSRRVFLKRERFELEPLVAFSANDALNRWWTFGLRGAYHFNEEFALDFGGGGGFNQPLKDIRLLGDPEKLDQVPIVGQKAYADIGVTFAPLYGKLALMAEQVAHFDCFVSAGLGAIVDESEDGVHPALQVGIGTRVFLTRWLTFRADVRSYTYPLTVVDPVTSVGTLTFPSTLLLGFGLGFHLPLDFDYSSEIIGAKG